MRLDISNVLVILIPLPVNTYLYGLVSYQFAVYKIASQSISFLLNFFTVKLILLSAEYNDPLWIKSASLLISQGSN